MRRCDWLTATTAALAGLVALPAAGACTCAGGVPEAKRFAASVQRRSKGRISGKVWVRTVRDGASCGLTTRRRVALYLDRIDGTWRAGLCSTASEAAIRAVVRGDRSARTAAAVACRRSA